MRSLNFQQSLWNVALLLCSVCMLVFFLHTNINVPNIYRIQLSDSFTAFQTQVLETDNLMANTYFDFFFILCYTLLFYSSIRIFFLSIEQRISIRYYSLSILPALFDITENLMILGLLDGTYCQGKCFSVFYWIVRLKWFVLIPFLLTALAIAAYHFIVFAGRTYNRLFIKKAMNSKRM
ncbi:hypothetical protein K1F50_06910 [Muricauda oceani]|uniref:Uncharacterized protein n=1 Tax=Flagellimonas oceani TaxID=2698672 RepID=A0A6G7J779_9FLAO|nr:hypothetical protein [Allomuricauda oceani]MBW8242527.1 hypothetical protein [Allomuricauda oceani]QII46287.1 hypothetical protein GVT53_16895 [Allomuricauda oceani]